jgi:hypothetical protein
LGNHAITNESFGLLTRKQTTNMLVRMWRAEDGALYTVDENVN